MCNSYLHLPTLNFAPFIVFFIFFSATACNQSTSQEELGSDCQLVENGFGPTGEIPVEAEEIVSGLEVPWGIAFLPNGDLLVTERPGRLRLVRDFLGKADLVPEPVVGVQTGSTSEGGLLGIVLNPNFEENRFFYLYVTRNEDGEEMNQVERWKLSADGLSAELDKVIYGNIKAASFHNGGRVKFGPDNMLYVGTGDATQPDLSQDPHSPNGKILRLTPEGDIPADNPIKGSPVFILGIRNNQGWDWPNPSEANYLWVVDHGPSGELGRTGHDEVNVAMAGENLGWPTIYSCEKKNGLLPPVLTWDVAVPPGGAVIYTGNSIPEWKGDLIIGTLGSRHLHRVVIRNDIVVMHEVYFQDELGRIRETIMGPDGELYITTSNCDGRGNCPPGKDKIFRITKK